MLMFYSEERWNNWINQVKESKFKFDPSAEGLGREGIVFLDMEEDVILAICKITGKLQNKYITKDDAAANIENMKQIVLSPVEPIDEDKDQMVESVQRALVAVFGAAEFFVAGDYDAKADPTKLIVEAFKAEEAEDMDKTFELVSKAGALVLSGKSFDSEKALEKVAPESLVAEGIDGLDSIAAVLAGGIDYTDEADDEE
jgi:hypothetical protein